jgi:ABC-type multidrug transport system fused ATPase/permease subunit
VEHEPKPSTPLLDGLRATSVALSRAGRLILRDVTFDAPKGQISALIAPSGAGKSTLLRCLDGVPVGDIDPRELRRRVALIGQFPVMLEGSVADNLRYGMPAMEAGRRDQALDDAGLDPSLSDRPANELSGGERARVALARALVRAPEVLVLDEPTAALDAPTADRIGRTLRGLSSSGLAVVLATHDLRFAADVADRVIRLRNGAAVTEPASRLLAEPPA